MTRGSLKDAHVLSSNASLRETLTSCVTGYMEENNQSFNVFPLENEQWNGQTWPPGEIYEIQESASASKATEEPDDLTPRKEYISHLFKRRSAQLEDTGGVGGKQVLDMSKTQESKPSEADHLVVIVGNPKFNPNFDQAAEISAPIATPSGLANNANFHCFSYLNCVLQRSIDYIWRCPGLFFISKGHPSAS